MRKRYSFPANPSFKDLMLLNTSPAPPTPLRQLYARRIRKEAAWAVSNATSGGTDDQIRCREPSERASE